MFQAEGTEIQREESMFEQCKDIDIEEISGYNISTFILIKSVHCKLGMVGATYL